MKRKRVARTLLVLGLLVASSLELLACRYNVRETGFVDLGVDSYSLFCFFDSEVPAGEISQLESLAKEVFTDSPISLQLVSVDQTPNHSALEYWQPLECRTQPSAALVSPLGYSMWIGPLWEGVFSPDQIRASLQGLISSPVRSTIAEELAEAFAVVLLIEGENQRENSRAQTAVLQAIATLESELEYFPKPIKKGPVLITLPREESTSERLLLWSLGFGPEDVGQPVAAVLYGRGRWIGPAMIGGEITLDLVSRILFIVGADCECGLDPRLIRGTGIPIPWNRSLQAFVSQDLGFDPDNPLVRMEVGQILKIDTWVDSRAGAIADQISQLEIPTPIDSSDAYPAGLVSTRLLYLMGGLAALILCLGALVLIRAERGKR